MRRSQVIFTLPLLVSFLHVNVTLAQVSVTLKSFNAIADIANQKITLLWEIDAELDFAGFYIQRSLNPDTGFEPLLDLYGDPLFFPAQEVGESGLNGIGYSYLWLKMIWFHGKLPVCTMFTNR